MIDVIVQWVDQRDKVEKAAEKGAYNSLNHAAASLRKDVVSTLLPSDKPSAPGTPPHTKKRQLSRAIVYQVDKKERSAVIGPRYSFVGTSGGAHEAGGFYKDRVLPPRKFMYPGLERALPRFASEFKGSMGE